VVPVALQISRETATLSVCLSPVPAVHYDGWSAELWWAVQCARPCSAGGGSQCVSHTLRSGLSCCPVVLTLQLVFRNAFNSMSRQALLQAVASQAPCLLPFVAWTYRSHGS
jgi:hypothetical protein